MASLLRTLARNGFRKGMLGGSRGWLYIGFAATGLRVVTWIFERKPEVVYRESLRPGERLQILALPPEER